MLIVCQQNHVAPNRLLILIGRRTNPPRPKLINTLNRNAPNQHELHKTLCWVFRYTFCDFPHIVTVWFALNVHDVKVLIVVANKIGPFFMCQTKRVT